ncbi:MAG TPA: hypothetical protein VHW90_10440 [Stellaceae bacterium]|jgi:hypothetical protein|nr:hypothetical protein [Stellaceae bacterium]
MTALGALWNGRQRAFRRRLNRLDQSRRQSEDEDTPQPQRPPAKQSRVLTEIWDRMTPAERRSLLMATSSSASIRTSIHGWEIISDSVHRFSVPGGWIYYAVEKGRREWPVFVPLPDTPRIS